MTDTPRSGSRTRFSTPVSDLDDHRQQPESLPRADGPRQGSRRGTLASVVNERPDLDRPDLPKLSSFLERDMLEQGMIARDFENAIVDDDRSIRSGRSGRSGRSARSGRSRRSRRSTHDDRDILSPNSPIVARRTTFRRFNHASNPEVLAQSRDSSRSRSTSPPNSVDAFAAPQRRRRAGTVNSQAPSCTNLTLERTASNGTAGRRRPTFSGDRPQLDQGDDARSRRSSVEDDVCFPPPEETSKTYTIDFEELEEFVAEWHKKTPVAHPFTSPNGNPAVVAPKIFNDLRPSRHGSAITESIDGKLKLDDEKLGSTSEPESDLARPPSRVQMAAANRWTFFSSEIDETVHAAELGGLLMPNETFRDLFELGPEGGVWWLDMLNPSEEEVFAICKAFGVHPLTREDITTQETREKVELFHSYYFVCFRSFFQQDKDSENFLDPINVYAVVFREGLLTFSFCANPHAAHVRKRIGRLRDYVNLSADWICYAFIDEIVDSFAPVLRDLEVETDAIEDSVFVARFEDSRSILRQIGQCRKRVMSSLRLLGGKADVIKGFAKRCNEQYSVAPRGDVGLYLSDVQDHVVTMMSNLNHFDKMLSRSHANYLAQISVDNIAQGNKANTLLGKVTLIATILVPLNLIAGLFGMNVEVPGKNTPGLAWFFGIVGFFFAIAVTFILIAKRLRYI